MSSVEVARDSSPYWTTVAATVPVFALALVLEVRRNASRWSVKEALPRLVGAGGAILYAGILAVLFVRSLNGLVIGGGLEDAWWVNALLIYILAAAVMTPLLDVAFRGTGDVWTRAWSRVPVSRVGKLRRHGRYIRREYASLIRGSDKAMKIGESALVDIRDASRQIDEEELRLAQLSSTRDGDESTEAERERAVWAKSLDGLDAQRARVRAVTIRLNENFDRARAQRQVIERSSERAEQAIQDAIAKASEQAMMEAQHLLESAQATWRQGS